MSTLKMRTLHFCKKELHDSHIYLWNLYLLFTLHFKLNIFTKIK